MVIVVDIDKTATELGLTAEGLKAKLLDLGLAQVVNEASRLAHGEVFDHGGKWPAVPTQAHILSAARSLLS